MLKLKYAFAIIISFFYGIFNRKRSHVLMYHSVNENGDLFCVPPVLFNQHLQIINSFGFVIVPFGTFQENSLAITFDDGFKDNFEVLRELNSKKISATIFIITDFIGSEGYLNSEELRELSKLEYIQLGLHGKTHTPLLDLSKDEWKKEISESKNCLEKIISKKIELMSFPHGKYNEEMISYGQSLGIKFFGTSVYGGMSVNSKQNRISITNLDKNLSFRQKINGDWDWLGVWS